MDNTIKVLTDALRYFAYERNPIGEKYIDTCSESCQQMVVNAIKLGEDFKAPKNELVPDEEIAKELSKGFIKYVKAFNQEPYGTVQQMMAMLAFCDLSKFGSSGKRPINKENLMNVCKEIGQPMSHYAADRLCKEFSTAEVSETILDKVFSNHNIEYNCTLKELVDEIKAELEGK